jgi:hypothetical protein
MIVFSSLTVNTKNPIIRKALKDSFGFWIKQAGFGWASYLYSSVNTTEENEGHKLEV